MRIAFLLLLSLFAAVTNAAPAQTLANEGFRIREPHLQSRTYIDLAVHVRRESVLATLAAGMNRRLRLPQAVDLRFAECGEANAFYEPDKRMVSICFELVERLAEDFGAQLDDDAELASAVSAALRFIVLHEVGHALVDVLELPITGREEDAVDQLSAWLLIGQEGGADAVLSAAAAFSIAGEDGGVMEDDFSDQHSLNQQRYFNMVCWVYGSDPDAGTALIEASGLPASRARACASEFARLDRSWRRLMQAHLR